MSGVDEAGDERAAVVEGGELVHGSVRAADGKDGWKMEEEKQWVDYASDRDGRLKALEQISLIAIFLAAFAVSDLSSYSVGAFTWPWGEVYLVLMANVVGCTTFISVIGTLTISTVNREAEWDASLSEWVTRTQAATYEEAAAALALCPTYRLARRQLGRLARFNTQRGTVYTDRAIRQGCSLGIPFSTKTLRVMADFNTTPLGFARAMFPSAVMCYLVALVIKFSQRAPSALIVVPIVFLLTWGLCITYYSRHLLTILGHPDEGTWMRQLA